MNKKLPDWYDEFWETSFLPEIEDIIEDVKTRDGGTLVLADGAKERVFKSFIAMRKYTRDHMQKEHVDGASGKPKKMDRHKLAACVAGALLHEKVLGFSIESPVETWSLRAFFGNEILAFQCGLNIMAAFILEGTLKKLSPDQARKIQELGFEMPPTHHQDGEGTEEYEWHFCRALRISRNLRGKDIAPDEPPVDLLLLSAIFYHIELCNLVKCEAA
ncbi:MAG: hypothetical protein HQL64_15585 [Magnetococcales bacterium]|nr:hypothetical protein [Magnetococcales bacterium]